MTKISKIVALLICLPSVIQASSVTLSSLNTGPSVFTSAGAGTVVGLVPNGSLIRVGTLIGGTTSAFFVEFGTSTVKAVGIVPNAKASKVSGSVTNTGGDNAGDDVYNGLPVYIWIYNSVTASATADQAIFKSSLLFPVNNTGAVTDAITISSINFNEVLAIDGFTNGAFNAAGDNATGNATGGQFVLGTAVPEISTSLLLVSFLGMVAFRRRR